VLSQGVVTRSLTNPAFLLTACNGMLRFDGCRAGAVLEAPTVFRLRCFDVKFSIAEKTAHHAVIDRTAAWPALHALEKRAGARTKVLFGELFSYARLKTEAKIERHKSAVDQNGYRRGNHRSAACRYTPVNRNAGFVKIALPRLRKQQHLPLLLPTMGSDERAAPDDEDRCHAAGISGVIQPGNAHEFALALVPLPSAAGVGLDFAAPCWLRQQIAEALWTPPPLAVGLPTAPTWRRGSDPGKISTMARYTIDKTYFRQPHRHGRTYGQQGSVSISASTTCRRS